MSNQRPPRPATAKKRAMVAVGLAFIGALAGMSSAFGNSRDDNKAFVQQMFHDVIEPDAFDEGAVRRYFSPNYMEKVDGKKLDFAGFSDHLRAVKAAVTNVHVTFDLSMAEGNKVVDIYRVVADRRTGGKMAVKVVALFEIKDGKIVRCDEDTHLEEGTAADKDLGSRSSKP
jgi:ketosteroid isomerase-like protein